MATDQGKLSNVPALALLAKARGKSIPETGTTMFRPPWTPVDARRLRRPRIAARISALPG